MLNTATKRAISPLALQLPEAVVPHTVAPAFAHLPGLALLESSQPGAVGRYSYLTADPFLRVESIGNLSNIEWRHPVQRSEVRRGQPFSVLRELLADYAISPAPQARLFRAARWASLPTTLDASWRTCRRVRFVTSRHLS